MLDSTMANSTIAARQNPTEGNKIANASVTIEAAAPASRLSFRATTKGAKAFGKSIGVDLPTKPGAAISKGGKSALWIGPDEWLIIDEKNADKTMVPKLANKEFAAIDVSHRNTAFLVSGAGAENTLSAGCPRDLSIKAFPIGTASRTVFGKSEVVIHRTGKAAFRVECWRSFAPYIWELLSASAKDAHI